MLLNYFTINLDFENYNVYSLPYEENKLEELRAKYNNTHSFFRNEDLIYISNKDGDDESVIGELVQKDVNVDNQVTSSLIKHIFFRTFKDRFEGYVPVDFYPFRFFSKNDKDDLILDLLPEELKHQIAYKKLIEVQLRQTQIQGTFRFGFTINIKRNWIFYKSCEALHNEGFELQGIEVLHSEILPGLKDILAPNEEFVGIIKATKGNIAVVNTNDGEKKFHLKDLFIRKTKHNIGQYLGFKLGVRKSEQILQRIEEKKSEIHNVKTLYGEILKIAMRLFTENDESIVFSNKDGFCFSVNTKPLQVYNSIELQKPTFIFDYSGTQTENTFPDKGLTTYGPYDSINFDVKTPTILCICNRTTRGAFTNFLSELKNGLPKSKYFKKGFQSKYDLQAVNTSIIELNNYDLKDYFRAISSNNDINPHLAIIEIPSSFRKYSDKDNPYYHIKAKLLSLEIPVQFITTEKIRHYNEYILNSISLQMYAKLGGTPWVLPSQRSVDREIIIGIGHSYTRENQFKGADQKRVVGITTFLSSDGQYLLGDRVKDVPFEEYFDELLNSLNNSIKKLSTEQGWSEGDTVRLIFHIFKPIKNTEFDVICELVKKIPEYDIRFAFVTISKSHPHILFDINQRGVAKYGSKQVLGEYIPVRASNVFLDKETCLVQMSGPNELKTARHAISSPIQIKIRTPQGNYENEEINHLLFYDLAYITQQIFSFTYLSWRSFIPSEQPATMLYSTLISNLLSKLRNVPNWDADKLNYGLKRKKWFL